MEDNLRSFINYTDNLYQPLNSHGDGFAKEFSEAKQYSTELKGDNDYKCSFGELPENKKKNRYKDILPFDATRVKLSDGLENSEYVNTSDYVNASFIQGAGKNQRYIASQGPLPATVNDFWKMLWVYKVRVVIMVCREIEMGKKKCERYWAKEHEEKIFGDIVVTSIEEQKLQEGYSLRTIKAQRGSEIKYIHQFHYNSWPDHGVPKTCHEILLLINHIRQVQTYSQDVESPLCVHCSAGCGRTGTVLAVDYVRNLLINKRVGSNLTVLNLVKEMRRQRNAMVQTKEQYQFVCNSIAEMFKLYMRKGSISFTADDILTEHYVNVEIKNLKPKICTEMPLSEIDTLIDKKSNLSSAPPPKPSRQRPENVPPKKPPLRPISMFVQPSQNITPQQQNERNRKLSAQVNTGSVVPPAKPPLNRRPITLTKPEPSTKPVLSNRPNNLPNTVPNSVANLSSPLTHASSSPKTATSPTKKSHDAINNKTEVKKYENVKLDSKNRDIEKKVRQLSSELSKSTSENTSSLTQISGKKSPPPPVTKTKPVCKEALLTKSDVSMHKSSSPKPTHRSPLKVPPSTKPKPKINVKAFIKNFQDNNIPHRNDNLKNSSQVSVSVFDLRSIHSDPDKGLKGFNRTTSIDGTTNTLSGNEKHENSNTSNSSNWKKYPNSTTGPTYRSHSLRSKPRTLNIDIAGAKSKAHASDSTTPKPWQARPRYENVKRTTPQTPVKSMTSLFESMQQDTNSNSNNSNNNLRTFYVTADKNNKSRINSASSDASSVFVTSPTTPTFDKSKQGIDKRKNLKAESTSITNPAYSDTKDSAPNTPTTARKKAPVKPRRTFKSAFSAKVSKGFLPFKSLNIKANENWNNADTAEIYSSPMRPHSKSDISSLYTHAPKREHTYANNLPPTKPRQYASIEDPPTSNHVEYSSPPQEDTKPTIPERTPESYITPEGNSIDIQNYEAVEINPNNIQPSHDFNHHPVTPITTTPLSKSDAGHILASKAKGMFDKTTNAISKVGASIAKTIEDDSTPRVAPLSVRERIATFSQEPFIYNGQDISYGARLNTKIRGPRQSQF